MVAQCTALINPDRAGSVELTWHQIALELLCKFHGDVRSSSWRLSGMVATSGTHTHRRRGSCVLAWAQVRTQWTVLLKQDGPMLDTNNAH